MPVAYDGRPDARKISPPIGYDRHLPQSILNEGCGTGVPETVFAFNSGHSDQQWIARIMAICRKLEQIGPHRIGIYLLVAAAVALACPMAFADDQDASRSEFYPLRSEWDAIDSTSPNISHFAYRDLNRNGIYDVGDRPMVEVAVTMSGPNGAHAVRRSNIQGFVNFTNSAVASPVDVSEPGEYVFVVQIPPGWELTSGNVTQTLRYEFAPGTRMGILANQVPVPAGLAPILTIEGRIAERGSGGDLVAYGDAELSVTGPGGTRETVPVGADGGFSISAAEGTWTIEARPSDGTDGVQRTVTVTTAPVQMSAMVIGETPPTPALHGHVVDFESITLSGITKIPNGVAGLNWNALLAVDNEFYGGEGYINTTMSGRFVSYNTSGYPVTIARDDGFDFRGGYFGVAWRSAEGETLRIHAWRGDTLIGSEALSLSSLGPVWFDADYRDITRLELLTDHYWQFVADDLSFGLREPPAN
jgi:hypothetical protein